jgi:hypothetical protein
MVTIFKNLAQTNTPFYRPIEFIFDRIKTGKSKEIVDEIRSKPDRDERNKIKVHLPAICFSGTFPYRDDSSIIEHSGYICLDFDKYENEDILNEDILKLKSDKYTFALFISPSGDGLKLIVKIPKDKENHKKYFGALEKYYNNSHFDTTSKNISRICFESYDPNIYINQYSELWSDKIEDQQYSYINQAPTVKLENESEIIKRLYKWFEKSYSMNEGQRNNNLFVLATSFSDFGINEFEAIRFCLQFEQPDFTKLEIEKVIRSAYSKCKSNFGMKYFEDTEKLNDIKKSIKNGENENEILNKYPSLDKKVLNELTDEINKINFWHFNKKGNLILDHLLYKSWLESNGFYKYYPDNSESFIFIKVTNNLIDNTNEVKIKDYVLSELLKNKEHKVYEYMAANPKYFKEDYLNILGETNIFFKEDTIDKAYIYFKNKAVEVSKEGFVLIDYIDLDGFVWRKHIIDFDFEISENIKCDFSKFIELISAKDENKINSITSTLGYMMHSFKTSANNKAVILNDETISENPNGGSGKGIFWNALSKVKRVADINGKSFSFDKSFAYQTVSADTQILVFDDVQKNFKFENLFSVITEGITLEKKNKDAIKIPVNKSPKILITTNYTVGGVGGSFERRKWEIEFSAYFSSKHTPLNEFGRMFFDEWDNTEWIKFYNYMLVCLQMYLTNGLISFDYKNLEIRKYIKETSFEFYEWANKDTIKENERLNKNMVFNQFLDEYPDFKKYNLSQKRFWNWVDKYAEFNNIEINKGQDSMGQRYIELVTDNIF